jgi:hypothetical protein
VAAAFVPSRAERAIPVDGHEFDTLAVDGAIAPAEAGLAIGERMHE